MQDDFNVKMSSLKSYTFLFKNTFRISAKNFFFKKSRSLSEWNLNSDTSSNVWIVIEINFTGNLYSASFCVDWEIDLMLVDRYYLNLKCHFFENLWSNFVLCTK